MPDKMPEKIGDVSYKGEHLIIFKSTYKNERDAIYLMSEGLLFATLSCNLPAEPLEEGEFFVMDWSENEELAPWILMHTDLFEDTGVTVETGFVQSPVWRFKKGVENA